MYIETQQQENTNNPLSKLFGDNMDKHQVISTLFSAISLTLMFILTLCGVAPLMKLQYLIASLYWLDYTYRVCTTKDNMSSFIKKNWVAMVLMFPIYSASWMVMTVCLKLIIDILGFILIKIHDAFYSMLTIGVSLVMFSSVSILQFEILKESNIKTPLDAIWWSICTITTVGYGDRYPITYGGKMTAIILMISGIGLFGTLIGYISTYFTDKEKKNNKTVDTIEELSHQIEELRKELINKK